MWIHRHPNGIQAGRLPALLQIQVPTLTTVPVSKDAEPADLKNNKRWKRRNRVQSLHAKMEFLQEHPGKSVELCGYNYPKACKHATIYTPVGVEMQYSTVHISRKPGWSTWGLNEKTKSRLQSIESSPMALSCHVFAGWVSQVQVLSLAPMELRKTQVLRCIAQSLHRNRPDILTSE